MQVTIVEVNEIGRLLLTINGWQPEAAVANMKLEGTRKATKNPHHKSHLPAIYEIREL
jgi:hypothetical protein